MRAAYRGVLGLIPALPVFYLAYITSNLIMAFVEEFGGLAKIFWEMRDPKIFMEFSMSWQSAFIMREGFQLIYIFIGLVVLYKYVEWYYRYVTKPKKDSRKRAKERENQRLKEEAKTGGIEMYKNQVIKKDKEEEDTVKYRTVEALRVEEDKESKEMMREILEVVKNSKSPVEPENLLNTVSGLDLEKEKQRLKAGVRRQEELGEQELDFKESESKVNGKEDVEDDVEDKKVEDDIFGDLGFRSMVTNKKAKTVLRDVTKDEDGY